ncbi:MAG TPA: kynureninase [Acidimicrobiales bacterium]
MSTASLDAREDEARGLDAADAVGSARDRFVLPKDDTASGHAELAYLAGNSLGPQAVGVVDDVRAELDDWATLIVEGHRLARRPWGEYHSLLRGPMARVVGARDDEVVVMNTLTVNLHFLLASFYRPTPTRFRIVIEDAAFPSDRFAFASHARFRGFDDAVVRLTPRDGERCLRTEDVIEHLTSDADRTALVILGGVNYLTGQHFDMPAITAAAQSLGITVGWDLAHAAGNVELQLHDLGADFAAWCTYKYLNGGPGSVGAAFVHERHLGDPSLHRLSGWWSTDPSTRFDMLAEMTPMSTADAWAVSNPPILSMTPLLAAMAVFDDVTMPVARARSVRLTGYLERLLDEEVGDVGLGIVTPRDPAQRGSQLSVRVPVDPDVVCERLRSVHGVVGDTRRPDVVRVAPAPLFATYHDCWRAARGFAESLS